MSASYAIEDPAFLLKKQSKMTISYEFFSKSSSANGSQTRFEQIVPYTKLLEAINFFSFILMNFLHQYIQFVCLFQISHSLITSFYFVTIIVDQINQSIDTVVSSIDKECGIEDEEKIVDVSDYERKERRLYQITQKRHLPIMRQQLKAKNRLYLKAFNTHAYYNCVKRLKGNKKCSNI